MTKPKRPKITLGTLLSEALGAILVNKSRTILTLLGIVIGISSVVTVLAAGAGGRSIIMQEFEGLSPTALSIDPNWQDYSLNRSFKIGTMTQRDIDDLEKYAPHLTAIAPIQQMRAPIRVGKTEKQLSVTGTTSAYIGYVEFELESGRIITDEEVRNQAKAAVIGYSIKEEFFPDQDPVGQYMTAFDIPIRIVGLLARKEKTDSVSISDPDETFNNAIVVPISLFNYCPPPWTCKPAKSL